MYKNRIPHNKINLNKIEYKNIRNLYFKSLSLNQIHHKTGFTVRVLQRIRNENKLKEKRERYYRFLCYICFFKEIRLEDICHKTGIKYSSLIRFRKKYGIRTRKKNNPKNKIINIYKEKKIIKDYINGNSSIKTALMNGFKTEKSVLDVLVKNKIDRREPRKPTSYNVNYFNNIDSCEKSYILGLLLTDGYVLKKYSGIGIQLTISDKYILERIKEVLGSSCSIIIIKRKKNIKYNYKEMARLTCHCPQIANDLIKFGIVKNKTYDLFLPKINKKFHSHLIRGIFDGDGSIGCNKRGYLWTNVVSASKKFIEDINKNIDKFNFSITERKSIKNNYSNIYRLDVLGGQSEKIRFLKWMYTNKEDWYLERKYEKVQNFIN